MERHPPLNDVQTCDHAVKIEVKVIRKMKKM